MILQFFQQAKSEPSVMFATYSQACAESLIAISANIEGLLVNKASMLSELCKKEHCLCLCLQETHRRNHGNVDLLIVEMSGVVVQTRE